MSHLIMEFTNEYISIRESNNTLSMESTLMELALIFEPVFEGMFFRVIEIDVIVLKLVMINLSLVKNIIKLSLKLRNLAIQYLYLFEMSSF